MRDMFPEMKSRAGRAAECIKCFSTVILEEKIQKSDFGTEVRFLIFVFFYVTDDLKHIAKPVGRRIEAWVMINSLKGGKYGR